MDNFKKYYSYFISEYVISELYDIFAPNDNMVSSGANMLSYIATLGSDGEIEYNHTDDLYKAIGAVVEAMFLDGDQFFITKDGVVVKAIDIRCEDVVAINELLVGGKTSDYFLNGTENGDIWFDFEIVDIKEVKGVGVKCLEDVWTNMNFVGAVPRVFDFILKVKTNIALLKVDGEIFEEYLEESIYSSLDIL